MFCYNCGYQLPEGAKFCPACGANQDMNGQAAPASEKKVSEKERTELQEEFSSVISEEVLDAYIDDRKINKRALYTDGREYHLTKADVDKLIADRQTLIKKFDQCLNKKILKGKLITLTVTKSLIDEILRYADGLGLTKEDAEAILDRFFYVNEIETRHRALLQLLSRYNTDGIWDMEAVTEPDGRLAVEQDLNLLDASIGILEHQQRAMHRESGKPWLSEEEYKQLCAAGRKVGFEQDIYITETIEWFERRNGYDVKHYEVKQREQSAPDASKEAAENRTNKKKRRATKKPRGDASEDVSDQKGDETGPAQMVIPAEAQKQEESEMFSRCIPTKRIELMGIPLVFPSNYFIENDIALQFRNFYNKIAEDAIKKCEECGVDNPQLSSVMEDEAASWPKRSKVWIWTQSLHYGLDSITAEDNYSFCDIVWDELGETAVSRKVCKFFKAEVKNPQILGSGREFYHPWRVGCEP